jgi:hypothetical protein
LDVSQVQYWRAFDARAGLTCQNSESVALTRIVQRYSVTDQSPGVLEIAQKIVETTWALHTFKQFGALSHNSLNHVILFREDNKK